MRNTIIKTLIVLVLTSSQAFAELVIDVQGVSQPTPVAVVPFGWEGEAPAMPLDVAAVIQADLKRSGRFAPIDEAKMLQKPTDGKDVDFQDWSFLGVEAIVVGTVVHYYSTQI